MRFTSSMFLFFILLSPISARAEMDFRKLKCIKADRDTYEGFTISSRSNGGYNVSWISRNGNERAKVLEVEEKSNKLILTVEKKWLNADVSEHRLTISKSGDKYRMIANPITPGSGGKMNVECDEE